MIYCDGSYSDCEEDAAELRTEIEMVKYSALGKVPECNCDARQWVRVESWEPPQVAHDDHCHVHEYRQDLYRDVLVEIHSDHCPECGFGVY
jgi:hypothetical protein